jgi:UDP-N-acetylmuramate: L-alanyl-gamma-D-glutamyl-meso-diaminopimelate ligase
MKHVHILGICGTFMGALAILAREKGYQVTGSDQNVYPPMSTYLSGQGIELIEGYYYDLLALKPDQVIVGNTMRRGMPIIENLLNSGQAYLSAPYWLYEEVLKDKKVIAIAGTHGKTTTTSLVIKLLEDASLNPGFLVGGISQDFGISSRLTDSPYFVIEADEYDTAFFDKRSKFMHYHPWILVINNLEFDHADIFNSMDDIYRQFHHLLRTMPGKSVVIYPEDDQNVRHLLNMGCWSKRITVKTKSLDVSPAKADFSEFFLIDEDKTELVQWSMLGEYNARNALSAYAVAKVLGLSLTDVVPGFTHFKGVKRRLECVFYHDDCAIYDDFAHHPTAVSETLLAMKAKAQTQEKVVAILEPRSNTMKMGAQESELIKALSIADEVWFYQNGAMQWQARTHQKEHFLVFDRVDDMVEYFTKHAKEGVFTHYVLMSNGSFEGLHQKLVNAKKRRLIENSKIEK